MKLMLKIPVLALILVLLSCSNDKKKIEKQFWDRYESIISVTPDELCKSFTNKCKNADHSSPFSKYTQGMIDSQCASIYVSSSKDLTKLVEDILLSEEQTKHKDFTVDEMLTFLETGNYKVSNTLDPIVHDSFQLIAEYYGKANALSFSSTN